MQQVRDGPEAVLAVLPETYIHILRDDEKEQERLRVTAKTRIAVVDKGIRGPGARFHLSIVGQVAGTPPVAEWSFAIDQEQELRHIKGVVQVSLRLEAKDRE